MNATKLKRILGKYTPKITSVYNKKMLEIERDYSEGYIKGFIVNQIMHGLYHVALSKLLLLCVLRAYGKVTNKNLTLVKKLTIASATTLQLELLKYLNLEALENEALRTIKDEFWGQAIIYLAFAVDKAQQDAVPKSKKTEKSGSETGNGNTENDN